MRFVLRFAPLLVILILGLALLASLAANWVLLRQVRQYYD